MNGEPLEDVQQAADVTRSTVRAFVWVGSALIAVGVLTMFLPGSRLHLVAGIGGIACSLTVFGWASYSWRRSTSFAQQRAR